MKTKLQAYLEKNEGKDLRVVFDLGSKAARMLIGPAITLVDLESWDPFSWFHIETRKIELLRDLGFANGKIDFKKEALEKTIQFINEIREILNGIVKDENFTLVGTEVFRVAKNKNEVLEKIENKTGFKVTVLDKEAEAFLSLLALTHTYKYPSDGVNIPEMKEDDIILLFDQGGGSTEISYYELKNAKFGEQSSLSQVGTNALRNQFFNHSEAGRVNPSEHLGKISEQFKDINKLVEQKISLEFDKQVGLKRISELPQKLHAFAMGSAIKNALEQLKGKYGRYIHCQAITISEIENSLKDTCYNLEESADQVKLLFNLLNSKHVDNKDKDRLENDLLLLYGLPAYKQLLSKFDLNEIRYSYFNLKHGVFLARNFYEIDNINIKNLPCTSLAKYFDPAYQYDRIQINSINNDTPRMHSENKIPPKNTNKKILILTAIKAEFTVLKTWFSGTLENVVHENSGQHFFKAELLDKGPKHVDFYIGMTGMGNDESSRVTERALELIKPNFCFFIGIAGGVKNVHIGDVIIPEIVYAYEKGRDGITFQKLPNNFATPTKRLFRIANGIFEDDNFRITTLSKTSNTHFGNDFNICFGSIAAGEKIIKSNYSYTAKFISENFIHENILAVEMEGKGFLSTCNDRSQVEYILVRGISDLLDNKEDVNEKGSKILATENACKVAFELIKNINYDSK